MSATPTVHATALALHVPQLGAPVGLLVTGPSGAGKSALALALLDEWAAAGRFAALVSDDRTVLRVSGKRLVARAPPELAGGIERRGLGFRTVPHIAAAAIGLHVAIEDATERMPEPATSTLQGVAVDRLGVPREAAVALAIVRAALLHRPWRPPHPPRAQGGA